MGKRPAFDLHEPEPPEPFFQPRPNDAPPSKPNPRQTVSTRSEERHDFTIQDTNLQGYHFRWWQGALRMTQLILAIPSMVLFIKVSHVIYVSQVHDIYQTGHYENTDTQMRPKGYMWFVPVWVGHYLLFLTMDPIDDSCPKSHR